MTIQAQAVELRKRFSIFIDKFNDIGNNLTRLIKSFNVAMGSAQSRLLSQCRRFAELAGQNGEIDVADQIDEARRKIYSGECFSLIPTQKVEVNFGDLDHFFGLDAYSMLNHQVGKLVSIDENKTWITDAVGESNGICSEFAGGDKASLSAPA